MKKSGISSRIVWTLVLLSVIWAAALGCMLWAGSQAAMIVGGVGLLATVAAAFALHAGVRKALTKPLSVLTQAADSLAKGEPAGEIPDLGTGTEVGRAVRAIASASQSLSQYQAAAAAFCDAIKEGDLLCRADASALQGRYRGMMEQMNDTVAGIMRPIDEAKEIFGRFFLNDYTQKMSEDYKGYMKEFADALNKVHYRFVNIQENFFKLTVGDTGRLEEFIQMKQKSENDRLLPAITKTLQAVRDLINESQRLADSAANGDLAARGDVDKFEGEYKKIISSLNKTMEAMIQPIIESTEVLEKVSEGDLTAEMTGDYKGDYNRIKESINHTVKVFRGILGEINSASEQVAAGARQVSESSSMLSHGATEQAGSVEELTASIHEISAQTVQNAENADHAKQLAEAAKENAVMGNDKMKRMLQSMSDINIASNNISKIIKVIDDIAFQTNILALNAAVEAARAGQHGKGFTVVAEEVRRLAARSANAANETTDLIKDTIKSVEEGMSIANETAEALGKIVEGVAEAAQLVNSIAAASNEQSAAISQVNVGIGQVSQVVQATSATSEESASASEELASQAEILKEHVSRFRFGTDGSASKDGTGAGFQLKKIRGSAAAPEQPPVLLELDKEAVGMSKY
jgi:methyl-accepting chemotaxis protein